MRKIQFFSCVLVLVALTVSYAQESHLDESEILELEQFVLILRDGEQIVIRGEYEVRGKRTYFYFDHGKYPVYSSLPTELIDFPGSDAANAKLQRDRQRRENYFRLIEERRRKILEESSSGSVIVTSNVSGFSVSEDKSAKQETQTISQQFPPYEENDVLNRPENWWRNESYRLFAALETSNSILRDLSAENDRLTVSASRARTNAEAQRLQQQINQVRTQINAERERGAYVGNRLAELSEWAEQLQIPLDWILPDGSVVYDESFTPDQRPTGSESLPGETDYAGRDLSTVPDSWWREEGQRLQQLGNASIQRLNDWRSQYNETVTLRDKADSDGEKIRLTRQLEAIENSINQEQIQIRAFERQLQQLAAAARKLGKEHLLGLMTERNDP